MDIYRTTSFHFTGGLATPPGSPEKTSALLGGTLVDFAVSADCPRRPRLSKQRGYHSLASQNARDSLEVEALAAHSPSKRNPLWNDPVNFSLLTPPSSPSRDERIYHANSFRPERYGTTTSPGESLIPLDGTTDTHDETRVPDKAWTICCTDRPEDQLFSASPTPSRHSAPSQVPVHPHARVDLKSPSNCPLPLPRLLDLDTPTPLTRAAPAQGAFPFPKQGRQASSLSPLAIRPSRPQSLPPQRFHSSIAPARSRRFSGGLDRFIPERSPQDTAHESFRLSKSPHELTDRERMFRRRQVNQDPFRHVQRGFARHDQSTNTPRATGIGSTSVVSNTVHGGRTPPTANTGRQISNGTVWNIGGFAMGDSVTGVSNGRGGLLGSGTNAPLYSAKFLTQADSGQELEQYEKRLALALDIDQTSRILGSPEAFESPSSSPTKPGTSSPHTPVKQRADNFQGDTVWRDNRWSREGSITCEYLTRCAARARTDPTVAPSKRAKPKKPLPIIPFR